MTALRIKKERAVSRSQLPLILEKVAVPVFDQLLFENYGIKLNEAERKWFALRWQGVARKHRKRQHKRRGGGGGNRPREPPSLCPGLL